MKKIRLEGYMLDYMLELYAKLHTRSYARSLIRSYDYRFCDYSVTTFYQEYIEFEEFSLD